MNTRTIPQEQSLVYVRNRKYIVEKVHEEKEKQPSTLIDLRCIEDDALGEALSVLWELEIDAQNISDESWNYVASRGFDKAEWFQAYFNTLKWGFVTSTDAGLFQSPYRAGIEVQTFQLEPLRRAIQMPHVNLFIADDVGLGKTIEAGLVLREMMIRQKVNRCVICVPPSVVHQWQEEMEQRFGISFIIYDRSFINEQRRQRGFGVNPWTTHSFFIVSHAMVRRHEHFTLLKLWLGKEAPQSMLILDEAHHAAPASGSKYAIDSKLTQTMRALCTRFTHRLFLSATPHNGHSNSFYTLLELLDPNLFDRGVSPKKTDLNKVMIRRLKSDLRGLNFKFPERIVKPIDILGLDVEVPDLKFGRLLKDYWELRKDRILSSKSDKTKRKLMASKLPIILLQKRLLSSLAAFHHTLEVHLRGVKESIKEYQRLYQSGESFSDALHFDEDYLNDDAQDEYEDSEMTEAEKLEDKHARMKRLERLAVSEPKLMKAEVSLLEQMTKELRDINFSIYLDPKLDWFITWVQKNICSAIQAGKKGGNKVVKSEWKERRVLIFTEYADTKDYIIKALNYAIYGNHDGNTKLADQSLGRVASFHGGMDEEQRRLVRLAFNRPFSEPGSDLRILVATDAAREGINLQSHCADLFHYDIPWNPGRMEQRNGRIDRKLQPAPQVTCRYFVLSQRVEDRVLNKLVEKSNRIISELGSFNPVISGAAHDLLKQGIDEENEKQLSLKIETLGNKKDTPKVLSNQELMKLPEEQRSEYLQEEQHAFYSVRIRTIKEEVNAERRKEVEVNVADLRRMLEKARKWIDFDQQRLRYALNAALNWMNLPDLEPVSSDSKLWNFPSLKEKRGHDTSWTYTLDALRASRKAGQKLDEWRDEAPLRPIVFEDDGSLHLDRVQLHLEHRVVRRLLQRFVAHGFTQDDLNRAAVIKTKSAIPSVFLLARLSLYGPHASRLHDELIWMDAEFNLESAALKLTHNEEKRTQSLDKLYQAFNFNQSLEHSHHVKALRTRVQTDLDELRSEVEKRSSAAEKTAKRKLVNRGIEEGEALSKRLTTLKEELKKSEKRIQKLLAGQFNEDTDQGELGEDGEEWLKDRIEDQARGGRQLRLDLEHVQQRIRQLTPKKIKEQKLAVEDTFKVTLSRLEPIGIVYLYPVSG